MVCIDGQKTSRASRSLKINESTAKYIVRTFLQKGKILEKTKQDKTENDLLILS